MYGRRSKLSRRRGSKSSRWRWNHETRRSSIPRWDGKWFDFFYFGYVRIRFTFDLFSGEFNLIMAREGRYFCEWLRGSFCIGKRFVIFDLFYRNCLLLRQLGGLLLLLFLLLKIGKVLFKFDDPCGSRLCCCWCGCSWGDDRRGGCFDWIENYLVSFASIRYSVAIFF